MAAGMRALIGCRALVLARRFSALHDPGMVIQPSSEEKEMRLCRGEWP